MDNGVKKESPMVSETERLAKETEWLAQKIEALHLRLQPVSYAGPVQSPSEKEPPLPPISPLVERLRQIRIELQGLNGRVKRMAEELEI
jgi:hypothetical protein